MEKISVIIPVYNVSEYLSQCIDSLIHQTYKNLEIILIDDGSTDDSGSICDNYAIRDNRIIVIHQKNSGVSAARNAGIAYATGDYIGFVDSDDYASPNMYEVLLGNCKYFNADYCISNRTLNQGTPERVYVIDRNKEQALHTYKSFVFSGDKYIPNSIWGGVILSSIAKKYKFPDDIHHYEDYLMQLQYLSSCRTVVITNEPLYYYRIREGSANRNNYNFKVASCLKIADYERDNHIINDEKDYCDTKAFFISQCYFSLVQSSIVDKVLSKQLKETIRHSYSEIVRANSIKKIHKIVILLYPYIPFTRQVIKRIIYK